MNMERRARVRIDRAACIVVTFWDVFEFDWDGLTFSIGRDDERNALDCERRALRFDKAFCKSSMRFRPVSEIVRAT